MNYEQKYNKLVDAIKVLQETNPSDEGIQNWVNDNVPELAESEGERIRRVIRGWIYTRPASFFDNGISKEEILAWLERQGEHLENFDEAEKEKSDFVGDGFIKCFANFLDFKEGNTYWLEYMGDDKYNVRSDNLLGKTYHITPCQLYTVFKKLTWLEKQGEQKPATWSTDDEKQLQDIIELLPDLSIRHAWLKSLKGRIISKQEQSKENEEIEKQEVQKPMDKVEPKFHPGDWIIRNNEYTGIPIQVIEFKGYYRCELNGEVVSISPGDVHNNFHLWTIFDAKPGDVLVYKNDDIEWTLIYKNIMPESCGVPDDAYDVLKCYALFTGDDLYENDCVGLISVNSALCFTPATKEQRDLLFQKMKEAGYEWDAEKKELKKIKPKTLNADKVIE